MDWYCQKCDFRSEKLIDLEEHTCNPRTILLRVTSGDFSGDAWSFFSIEEADEFIVNTRKEGCEDLVAAGTMTLYRAIGSR